MRDSLAYDIFIDTLEPVNSFANNTAIMGSLTYDQVEVIKQVFKLATIKDIKDVFIMCYRLKGTMKQSSDMQFYSTSVFDLFRAKRFIQEWITMIVKREINTFTSIPDDKLIMINASERLAPFNHSLSKIRLAEQFSTEPKYVGRWKYNYVFGLLASNKIYNDIQREKAEIK